MPAVDVQELGELMDRHAAALELYASQWTEVPEDCVQEAFIELARQRKRPSNMAAWLFRVVRHRAMNAARAARRRAHHEASAADRRDLQVRAPSRELEANSLSAALATLETEDREIVVLRIWSGLTWQQIAEIVHKSSSSAQRQYVAALAKLRHLLEPSCETKVTCRPN